MASSKPNLAARQIVYPDGCKELVGDLSKDEIIKRLVRLAKEFQEMGQENNKRYEGLAIYLASEFFMDHANKDIRLLTACCIADIFRIFAPDAPYTEPGHLKLIFQFLVKQLRGLEDTDSVSFKRYFYLLENLAWVKSFNICIELEDSQEIFTSLFKMIFSIVNPSHTHKVKSFMLDLMCPLITESDIVSQDLLDAILMNIIEPNKTLNKEACQLAKELIKRTANAIEPFIQAFFNNCLLLGKTSESEVSDHLYSLIYELNQIAPSVLLAVLPQLEYKLKSNDEEERKALTRLLAKMFSEKDSDLAMTNKPLWQCFLGRFNDINVQVRTTCVQSVQHFILNQPELLKEIKTHLTARLHDQEECVRMDAVATIVNAAKKNLAAVPDDVLDQLKERIRDKKFKIRKEALLGLGQIYKKELLKEDGSASELHRFSWIRSKILHVYYQNSLDDKILVERVFKLCLVPYTMDCERRMATLYELFADLDDPAVKAMREMLRCQHNVVLLVRQLLDLLKCEQTPDTTQLLAAKILSISRNLPDQPRMHEHIKRFANIVRDDARIRKQLSSLLGQEISCKRAEECVKEILKKMGNPTPQNVFYTCIKTFLERIAPVLIDSTSMRTLVAMVAQCIDGDEEKVRDVNGDRGSQLLLMLSQLQPGAFDDDEVFRHLLHLLDHQRESVVDMVLQIFCNTGDRVQKRHVIYEELLPKLIILPKQGIPKQAKHAIMCLKSVCRDKEVLTDLAEHLKLSVRDASDNLLTVLVALGYIAQLGPQEISTVLKPTIVQYVVKNILLNDEIQGEETDDDWWDEERISEETRQKIEAMKLMSRWCLGLRNHAMAQTNGPSTIKMLNTMILHDGDILQAGLINKPERSRLRLQAACCIIKLAQEPVYAAMITQEQFHTLAYVMADPCANVRTTLCAKLNRGLLALRLPLQYMSMLALAAPYSKADDRHVERNAIVQNISKRREYIKQQPNNAGLLMKFLPDYVLPYAIHLLAHNPDLVTFNKMDALKRIKDCLWFLLEPLIVKNDTYSYTFYRQILENIKHRRDALNPYDEETNKKLYAVCDLAIGLITSKSSNFVLKDHPIEPSLPEKLFVRAEPSFTNTKSYLPKELCFTPPRRKAGVALMPKQGNAETSTGNVSTSRVDGTATGSNDDGDSADESQQQNNGHDVTTDESSTPEPPPPLSRKRKARSVLSTGSASSASSPREDEADVDTTADEVPSPEPKVNNVRAKTNAHKKHGANEPSTATRGAIKAKRLKTSKKTTTANDVDAQSVKKTIKKSNGVQTTLKLIKGAQTDNLLHTDSEEASASAAANVKKASKKVKDSGAKAEKTANKSKAGKESGKENKMNNASRKVGRPKKSGTSESGGDDSPSRQSVGKTLNSARDRSHRNTPSIYKRTPDNSPMKTASPSTASPVSQQISDSAREPSPKKVHAKKTSFDGRRTGAELTSSPRKALIATARGKKRRSTTDDNPTPAKRSYEAKTNAKENNVHEKERTDAKSNKTTKKNEQAKVATPRETIINNHANDTSSSQTVTTPIKKRGRPPKCISLPEFSPMKSPSPKKNVRKAARKMVNGSSSPSSTNGKSSQESSRTPASRRSSQSGGGSSAASGAAKSPRKKSTPATKSDKHAKQIKKKQPNSNLVRRSNIKR